MYALLISIVVSFFTTVLITPKAIEFLRAAGVVSMDLHKKNKPVLPASGGVCVAAGIIAGLLVYVGIKTFVYGAQSVLLVLLAIISGVLIVTFTGFLDDLNVKLRGVRTKDGINLKVGISQWIKPLLTVPAAIPLMAVNAGYTNITLPLFGAVDLGIIYPLLFIPIGFVGAANMVNMLGGFNGAEAGMGVVYCLTLGLFAFMLSNEIVALLFYATAASLLAFLVYNRYPARILPGDSLTYLLGSVVAAGVIVANMERVGLIVMTPFILQGILKFYSRWKMGRYASDIGLLQKDGTIKSKYDKKIYSWTHLIMRFGKPTEKRIIWFLVFIQIIFSAIALLLYFKQFAFL
jgi:UDP-N-acetylglucosamine--dolichyl-phosphate N-acetylglucosaminephosphotransferase